MAGETCEKHDATMERLFSSISSMTKDQAVMVASVDRIEKFAADIHQIVYGNGREGLISKVRRVIAQVNWLWVILILILGSLIGYGVVGVVGK